MTKQEQVEEMAKVIEKTIRNECVLKTGGCDACNFLGIDTDEYECQSLLVSTMLYNAGYRKVLLDTEDGETFDCAQYAPWQLVEWYTEREVNKARKETAKEILILLGKGFDETKMTEFKNLPWYKLFYRELKQKYGVEVE